MIRSLVAIPLLALLIGCSQLSYVDRQTGLNLVKYPQIRVKILDVDTLTIECTGAYRLYGLDSAGAARGYFAISPLVISHTGGLLTLSEPGGFVLDSALAEIFISPRNRQSHLLINAHPFRGILRICGTDSLAAVINILNLEDYLQGVLPPEIGKLDSEAFEALKAQAVASRTYAYARLKTGDGRQSDLANNILDQVYVGIRGEYDLANRAVQETRGEILVFKGHPIDAYFHSTCGGHTEEVVNVWNQHKDGYLIGIDDDGYCQWSKYYRWEMRWNATELAGYIRDYLAKQREFKSESLQLRDIIILERFPSGRIAQLSVRTDHGEFFIFKDQIRWAFRRPGRPDLILPSSDFELTLSRDSTGSLVEIIALGKGYGHGVGMCQTGAIGRARAGQKYDQILKSYYSGVELIEVY